jgi:hypothetical protein
MIGEILFFAVLMPIVLVQWWIHKAKILPYIKQFRDTTFTDHLTGPHLLIVMHEYKQYCQNHGGDITWYRLQVWLTIAFIAIAILWMSLPGWI